MSNRKRRRISYFKKIKYQNVLPFIFWPLLFLVAIIVMYSRIVSLYVDRIEDKGYINACDVADTFHEYLDNVDSSLKSSVAAMEYMMEVQAPDEDLLEYITYESSRLGIISSTGSRGIFGVFRGKFLHGLGWNPANYDPTDRIWYKEAVAKDGKYTFVGPYFNKRTDEYVVTAVKLLDDKESVIAFAIDYDTFKKMTTGISVDNESTTILAMDENGFVLCDSNSDEFGEDYSTSDEPLKKAIYDGIATNKGKDTFTVGNTSEIENLYIVSRKHVIYDLYVVTVTDANYGIKDMRRMIQVFTIVLVLGMLIILFLNFRSLFRGMIARERMENLASISNIYVTIHRIDLVNDTFEQVACIDYRAIQILDSRKDLGASGMMKLIMPKMVDQRSREDMMEFVDLSTIQSRLRIYNTITMEFLSYEHIWHRARFVVVSRDKEGNVEEVLFATEVIDDEKRARDRFQYLAETDQLTGINNRGSGEAKIHDLLLKSIGGMFILFDVDKFKYVNDTFGHDVGDEVLIGIGEKMRHTFRDRDIIMRLGGDEFAAYTPGVFDKESGEQILDRLIDAIHRIDIPVMGDHKIDISIGAAFYFPTDSFSFEELYKRADNCTYSSKRVQGSVVTFYERKDSMITNED